MFWQLRHPWLFDKKKNLEKKIVTSILALASHIWDFCRAKFRKHIIQFTMRLLLLQVLQSAASEAFSFWFFVYYPCSAARIWKYLIVTKSEEAYDQKNINTIFTKFSASKINPNIIYGLFSTLLCYRKGTQLIKKYWLCKVSKALLQGNLACKQSKKRIIWYVMQQS